MESRLLVYGAALSQAHMALVSKERMTVDWKLIDLPRWYDCKLGRMSDQALADAVGTTKGRIRRRRLAFGFEAFSVDQLIAPYRHLLGVESDTHVARLCGASLFSVTAYREAQGIAPRPRRVPLPRKPRIPASHPVAPYKVLLGLVADEDIAKLAGVPVATITVLREAFGLQEAAPLPEQVKPTPIPNYTGPWLGFESLIGTMSAAKISRAVGVPFTVVERRQEFLGVTPYRRTSRLERYSHLLGVVSNGVLGKLAGVSPSRVADYRAQKASERESS